MMNNSTNDTEILCLYSGNLSDVIPRFLEGILDENEEEIWLKHVDGCRQCQIRLEQSTENSFQNDAHTFLSDFPEPEFSDADLKDPPELLKWVQLILGPTDNPQMLGRVGKYEVIGIIGAGSSGIVLKAFEPELGRFVALKVLSPSLAIDKRIQRQFQQEARSMASVKDPNVVPIFGIDRYQQNPFLVMQLVTGGNLHHFIKKNGTLSVTETVSVALQVALGLAAAHKSGLIHRDIKPENVLLDGSVDRVLVSDFGLARAIDRTMMTRSGFIAGTPEFMSPEQAKAEKIDHRSDLFSLGSLMYCCLTGSSPFKGDSVFGVIKKVADEAPKNMKSIRSDIPRWLACFVNKLLSKSPLDRFESATEVSEILQKELAYLRSPEMSSQPDRSWIHPYSLNRKLIMSAALVAFLAFVFSAFSYWPKSDLPSDSTTRISRKDELPAALSDKAHLGSKSKESYFDNLAKLNNLKNLSSHYSGESVDARLDQASKKLSTGSYNKVVDICKEVLSNDSHNPKALLLLGLAEMENRSFVKAEEIFLKLSKNPEHKAHSHYNIACIYSLSNRPEEAIDQLEKAIEFGYRDFRNILTDEDLDAIHSNPRFTRVVDQAMNEQKKSSSEQKKDQEKEKKQSVQQLLSKIVAVAKKESMYSSNVDWEKLETTMKLQLGNGKDLKELAVPVQHMLYELGDYHGAIMIDGRRYFAESKGKRIVRKRKKGLPNNMALIRKIYQSPMTDKTKIHSEMLKGKIAYIEIPAMGPNQSQIHPWARKVRTAVNDLLAKNPKGIIIDLRTNLGGNMHPMFAGLGRLYPNIDMGGQTYDGESLSLKWSIRDGNVYLGEGPTTKLPKIVKSAKVNLPIAVLTSRYTCSSGEALASGFLSQKNTKLFGEHTSGYSTCNAWFPINDRVILSPAVGYYMSKNKVVHHDGITPEVEIEEEFDLEHLTKGKTIDAARNWILSGERFQKKVNDKG